MSNERLRVLLVEDNPGDARLFREALGTSSQPSFELTHVQRLSEALERLGRETFDAVLLDLSLPDSQGLETFQKLHDGAPEVPTIVLTGLHDDTVGVEAVRRGAQDYLTKGDLTEVLLTRTIRYSIERERIRTRLDTTSSELREANARLERHALHDPLTEIRNRRGLERVLTREIQWSRRDDSDLLVLFVDLDDFKQINDQHGHAVGDAVLRQIARKLEASVRTTDYVARIGGDEFVILLPHTRPAEGMRVADKVRLAIAETPVSLSNGNVLRVTASLGFVTLPPGTVLIDELLAQTHLVLYQSKHAGKNRVTIDPRIAARTAGNQPLADVLEALRRGDRFLALIQPIVHLGEGREVAFEFLTRSTVNFYEMPDDFFRISIEANILSVVDQQCLRTCIAAASRVPRGARCHVNLFPSTILDVPHRQIVDAFEGSGHIADYCIEISEQQIIGEPSYLALPVQEYKKSGFQIAIDDVGFGRSCLESLVILEPDLVKIDRKWVDGVSKDRAREQSLRRLLQVTAALGTEVVAEGVETMEDLAVLKDLGVEYGQGYLFGKPQPDYRPVVLHEGNAG